MSSVIMHGLSIMSHSTFFQLAVKLFLKQHYKVLSFIRAAYRIKPFRTRCSKPCRFFFYSTSFNTQPHFQTQFHSHLNWMDSTPSTERPQRFPPKSWGRLREGDAGGRSEVKMRGVWESDSEGVL